MRSETNVTLSLIKHVLYDQNSHMIHKVFVQNSAPTYNWIKL